MVKCATNREVPGLNFDAFPVFSWKVWVFYLKLRVCPRPCQYAYRNIRMNADLLHLFRNLSIAGVSLYDAPITHAVKN